MIYESMSVYDRHYQDQQPMLLYEEVSQVIIAPICSIGTFDSIMYESFHGNVLQ